jgi:glycogen debranching enzyme
LSERRILSESGYSLQEASAVNSGAIEYPILDVYDLGSVIKDVRYLLPVEDQRKLQRKDKVVHVHVPEIFYPEELPSAIMAIKDLTGAPTLAEIGKRGPSVASLSTAENKGVEAMSKYEVVHGRDALRVAFDLHEQYPDFLMASTIMSLAEQQGLVNEEYIDGRPCRQEERGRIMLLNRGNDDPVGRRFSRKLGWGWPFYGSIDATPSFVVAIATQLNSDPAFLEREYIGRDGENRRVKDALDLAVDWLLDKTARTEENPEGLLEFKNKAPKGKGILNQSWKDSAGAYIHADGTWANHEKGIASVEVQGLAYDALIYAAQIYRNLGEEARAALLEKRAADLRAVVLDKFWVEDERGGYFALGTDRDNNGNLRVMKVRTSNMGQLLASQLLTGDEPEVKAKVEATVRTLFSPEMLSRWGVRTLSNREAAFRQEGYHVGSVWLWDNDAVGAGLDNHGYHGLARYLWGLSLEVINKTKMFPEFIQGGDDEEPLLNSREIYVWDEEAQVLHLWEQLPQQIQAWSVSSALATKRRNFLVQLRHAVELDKQELEDKLLAPLPLIALYDT